jgi:hypothetical protein
MNIDPNARLDYRSGEQLGAYDFVPAGKNSDTLFPVH